MTPADRRRLLHAVDAIGRIDRYCTGGRPALDDAMTQDAVLRCLTVIGEALSALSDETLARLESLPPHLPRGQRNILVHEYWRIDLNVIWNTTVACDLPPLKDDIESVL